MTCCGINYHPCQSLTRAYSSFLRTCLHMSIHVLSSAVLSCDFCDECEKKPFSLTTQELTSDSILLKPSLLRMLNGGQAQGRQPTAHMEGVVGGTNRADATS